MNTGLPPVMRPCTMSKVSCLRSRFHYRGKVEHSNNYIFSSILVQSDLRQTPLSIDIRWYLPGTVLLIKPATLSTIFADWQLVARGQPDAESMDIVVRYLPGMRTIWLGAVLMTITFAGCIYHRGSQGD